MRGIIYKDFIVFFKSIDKKTLILLAGAIILLMLKTGTRGGFFATIMFTMIIGMQNLIGFADDEKAGWKNYQLAMPVSGFTIVAGKYISVVYTLAVGIVGSFVFNIITCIMYKNFDLEIICLSAIISIIIPLLWTGICLPLTYWLGFQSAQIMRFVLIIPMFYFVKYFEDGPGLNDMINYSNNYIIIVSIITIVIYIMSMFISVLLYERRKL